MVKNVDFVSDDVYKNRIAVVRPYEPDATYVTVKSITAVNLV